ncbi:S-layer homology domain-containing protein, partial [Bacillus sp. B-TM1]
MKYRAVAAGILAASLLSSPVSSFAAAKKFSDVPTWAQESVDYLVGKKALVGKPDGTFSPSEAVDKGSAAKILAVVLGLPIDPKAKQHIVKALRNKKHVVTANKDLMA